MMKIRTVMAAFALLCLALPIPVTSAGPDAGSGCHPYTSDAGSGTVWFSDENDYDAHGYWVDGCGGKACDDHVQGKYGGSGSFSVVEISGRNDNCIVRCTLDGTTFDMRGNVITRGGTVDFGCEAWFVGYLSLDPSTLAIYISGTGPI